jgi:hypothetical protein
MSTKRKETSRTDPDRVARYLNSALRQNPLWESESIMELRSRFLGKRHGGKPRSAAVAGNDTFDQRVRHENRLQKIRDQFWTADIEYLQRLLSKGTNLPFADLQHAFDRLRVVAANRHCFAEVAEIGSTTPNFFRTFREVLVADPQTAGRRREYIIQRARDIRALRKVIRKIRKVMPDVYDLEADWLKTIEGLKSRKTRKASASSSAPAFEMPDIAIESTWLIRILIFLAIVILRLLI